MQITNEPSRFHINLEKYPDKIIALIIAVVIVVYVMITIEMVLQPLSRLTFPDIQPIVSAGLPGKVFPSRIWLHGVNSLEMARYADEKYTGMEIDVMFDDKRQCFDVRRPSASSVGLSLNALIAEINDPGNHFYWLDFKNLTPANKQNALSELCKIAQKYKILSNIIVESSNPAELVDFSRQGFYTSYYLPDIDPTSVSTEILKSHIHVIIRNLAAYKVNALSANSKQYILIKKYFVNYDLLLWNFTDNPLALKLTRYTLMQNHKVKVLLVEDCFTDTCAAIMKKCIPNRI